MYTVSSGRFYVGQAATIREAWKVAHAAARRARVTYQHQDFRGEAKIQNEATKAIYRVWVFLGCQSGYCALETRIFRGAFPKW